MRRSLICIVLLIATTPVLAVDLEAGKAKAATVCAACHGSNGVSVADDIPNLAAQRAGYLASQLAAFKAGSRKSEIMNAIAPQLSSDDMSNVAAHFASLPAAGAGGKSAFLPNLARTQVTLPANVREGFTRYHTINVPEEGQVKIHYANQKAMAAAAAGKPLPDGSMVLVEIYSAKLDGNKKPVMDSAGFFVPDQLRVYVTMARDAGWGTDIPDILRNEDWNYAIFNAKRIPLTSVNQAECLACHKPAAQASFVFTLKEMAALAGKK